MSELQVCIIGAGIMGLTTAYRIMESLENPKITIFAEEFTPNTTSDFSNGFWEPFSFSENDCTRSQAEKWAPESYKRFVECATASHANECGAQLITTFVLSSEETKEDPFWQKMVLQYKSLTDDEIRVLGFSAKLESNGVKFVKKRISKLDDVINEMNNNQDFIINCTEYGARKLFNDEDIYRVVGHIISLEAPWLTYAVIYDSHPNGCIYALPTVNKVLVGGSVEKKGNEVDVSKLEVNEKECEKLFQRCSSVVKPLTNAKVINKSVGSWSARKGGVRLELETVKFNQKNIPVIHNYGHGGSGITLSWGCASEVVELLKNELSKK